jgi:small subunit ribosomal protein S7
MRKSKPKKRITLPDPKFGDVLVTKFVNNMMYSGKKNLAYQIFYDALEIVDKKVEGEESPLDIFKKALNNVTPAVEVRSRRIGGATFQIPSEIRNDRKSSIAMKNMIGFARKRHEKNMAAKLAGEIIAAHKEEGAAFKKKEDTHRMAEANKAFSHFRF